jgi:hypothetical protein
MIVYKGFLTICNPLKSVICCLGTSLEVHPAITAISARSRRNARLWAWQVPCANRPAPIGPLWTGPIRIFLNMSSFWFGSSARRAAQNDVRPGNRYRRAIGTHSGAIATVLELCPDLVGIPHVRFTVAVDRSPGQLDEDTRMLALQSFLETYCERVLQADPEPEPR